MTAQKSISNIHLQTKNTSNTLQASGNNSDAQQMRINKLQAELTSLRNEQRNKSAKNDPGLPREAETNQTVTSSATPAQTQEDILQLINQTMATLQDYAKRFTKQSDTAQTQLVM